MFEDAAKPDQTERKNIDSILNARSVAFAGVSKGNWGYVFLNNLLRFGYSGKVYALNPKGGEISGMKMYANVKDIPEPVDYVFSCVPARALPQLIEDCTAKGVKMLSIFTAGFSELGTDEGRELELEISCLCRPGGPRLIGPNCMGVYYPAAGLSFAANFPEESGRVALLCQSGGNATCTIRAAGQRGVRFSKAFSYGNACDIDESELLEYFATDPETEIAAAYIEGVKDGQRFFRVLKEAANKKPVIVLKGGHTEAGAGAAASHTGALAGSGKVWDGVLQQAGAIQVHSLEELVDLMVTFSFMPPTRERGIGMLGIGGGASVLAADQYAEANLNLPPLTSEMQDEIRVLMGSDAGMSANNPLDLSYVGRENLYRIAKILSAYEKIDFVIVQIPLGMVVPLPPFSKTMLDPYIDTVTRLGSETSKPVAMVIHSIVAIEDWEVTFDAQQKCYEAGVPVYHSIASAAKAIDRFSRYHENRSAY